MESYTWEEIQKIKKKGETYGCINSPIMIYTLTYDFDGCWKEEGEKEIRQYGYKGIKRFVRIGSGNIECKEDEE